MAKKRTTTIEHGTVIDHIPSGKAAKVVHALKSKDLVAVLMNVGSKKLGRKDVVKIECRYLDPKMVKRKIAKIAPMATVNHIKHSIVINKARLKDV